MTTRVAVAMSGGVDSTVATLLLRRKGMKVRPVKVAERDRLSTCISS